MSASSNFAVPPLPPARRDGDRLVVARGADISGSCLQCAGAPHGRPVVRHLPIGKGALFGRGGMMPGGGVVGSIFLLIDLLLVLVWLVWLVIDWRRTRRRRVSFSLRAQHRRQRRYFIGFGRIGLPLGIVLMLIGIFGNQPAEWDLLPYVPGIVLIFCGMMAFAFNPDPQLAAENTDFLWLKNVGEPFLARQPPNES